MKIECNIIQDLLPLYIDKVCSAESSAAVEKHIKECSVCSKIYKHMATDITIQTDINDEFLEDDEKEGKQFKKGLLKVRRRWALSLILTFLSVPVLLLSIAQFTGEGICFSNIGVFAKSYYFMNMLKNGNYEKAFEMFNLEDDWRNLTDYNYYFGDGIKCEEYINIKVDGEEWYFHPVEAKRYFDGLPAVLNGEEALDFWITVLQHTQESYKIGCIMPKKAYEDIIKAYGDINIIKEEESFEEIYSVKEIDSLQNDTKKNYILIYSKNCADIIENIETINDIEKNIFILYDISYITKNMWEYAMEQQNSERLEFEERAKIYLSVGYDKWKEAAKERFVSNMKQFEEKYGRMTKVSLKSAEYYGDYKEHLHIQPDKWQFSFSIEFLESKKGEEGSLSFYVRNGKVVYTNGGYKIGYENGIANKYIDMLSRLSYEIID